MDKKAKAGCVLADESPSYTSLAWLERLVSLPEEYLDEIGFYLKLLEEHAGLTSGEMLHLGCGAGAHDVTFKQRFRITGVDIAQEMLDIARERNPEATYLLGDMRDVALGRTFDVVAIPDSIDYMATSADLARALATARAHLAPGGVLLITAKVAEEFRDNNFVYTGAKDDVDVTIFENNHILRDTPDAYEATIVYLIRRGDQLETHVDVQRLGIFSEAQWLALFEQAGFSAQHFPLLGTYEPFILGEGEYPMRVYVARLKPD